jgi:hypothetical protein
MPIPLFTSLTIISALYLAKMDRWNILHVQYYYNNLEICNAYNVDKLLVVNPIEFVNYFECDDPLENPIETENAVHDKVLKEFKKSVIMRVNMVFGSNSYFVRYLQQNWLCNHAPFNEESYKHFRFNPMYLFY